MLIKNLVQTNNQIIFPPTLVETPFVVQVFPLPGFPLSGSDFVPISWKGDYKLMQKYVGVIFNASILFFEI